MKFLKKAVSVILTISLLPTASFNVDAASPSQSVMTDIDGTEAAQQYIAEAMVLTDTSFYSDGAKKGYNASSPYWTQSGELMLPSDICAEVGFEVLQDSVSYNGTPIAVNAVNVNDDKYFPLKEMCALAGINTYDDNRGFVVVSTNEITLHNSAHSADNAEPSDSIFRYMHFDRPSGGQIIETLKKLDDSPRLLITPERAQQIKEQLTQSEYLQQMYDYTISEADNLTDVNSAAVEWSIPDGKRLLAACRKVLERMKTLSAAYAVTGNEKYAKQIYNELTYYLDSCAWPNWNTQPHTTNAIEYSGHFLDSGFMALAVAMGYDAIRGCITDEQKAGLISRIQEVYLADCIRAYEGTYTGTEFRHSTSNWGAVCSGGLLAMCLSIAKDADAELSQSLAYLIENSMHSMEYPFCILYPDGAWYESVNYWDFTAEFLSLGCIVPLMNFCGDDFGFLNRALITKMLQFEINTKAPNGVFNYSDIYTGDGEELLPSGYAMSLLLNSSELMTQQYMARKSRTAKKNVLNVLYFSPELCDEAAVPQASLDSVYKSTEISVLRESMFGEYSSYFAAVGGTISDTGSHFDKGSFVFDKNGTRWAIDLGQDNYNVKGGYSGINGATLYRKRTEGHNCVVINPIVGLKDKTDSTLPSRDYPGQTVGAEAEVVEFSSSPNVGYCIYDLTHVYSSDNEATPLADNVSSYKRGFLLGDGRQALTVRDEISLNSAYCGEDGVPITQGSLYWFMHYDTSEVTASVSDDGKKVIMKDNSGNQLYVNAAVSGAEDGWSFTIMEAEPFDADMTREGEFSRAHIKKLALCAAAQMGAEVTITVKLSETDSFPADISLAQWKNVQTDEPLHRQAKIISAQTIKPDCDNVILIDTIIPCPVKKAELYVDGELVETRQELGGAENQLFKVDTSCIDAQNTYVELVCYYDDYTSCAQKDFIIHSPEQAVQYEYEDFDNLSLKQSADGAYYMHKSGEGAFFIHPQSGHIIAELVNEDAADKALQLTITDSRGTGCGFISKRGLSLPQGSLLELDMEISTDDPIHLNVSATSAVQTLISFILPRVDGSVKMILDGKTFTVVVRNTDGHVIYTEKRDFELNGEQEEFRLTFFSVEKAGSKIRLDNYRLAQYTYSPLVVKAITRDNGTAALNLNTDIGYKAFSAIYSNGELTSVTTPIVSDDGIVSTDISGHTKLFFWNETNPVSKAIEFSKPNERKGTQ